MGKRLGADLDTAANDPVRIVEQLQLAQRGHVQGLRTVMQLQARVAVCPADSAARGGEPTIGSTRELRTTGTLAVFAIPITVGSFFRLAFDASAVDLPPVFARCDRCTLLAEDEFEVRFHFLAPVVLPVTTVSSGL